MPGCVLTEDLAAVSLRYTRRSTVVTLHSVQPFDGDGFAFRDALIATLCTEIPCVPDCTLAQAQIQSQKAQALWLRVTILQQGAPSYNITSHHLVFRICHHELSPHIASARYEPKAA